MKCPFCRDLENKVIDSRLGKDEDLIRRRRECANCERRFTTYERVEEVLPMVVKKGGGREAYERLKVVSGLSKACEKRPVSSEDIERLADNVERAVQEKGLKEVPAELIGEAIMAELYELDKVAYVRFASVYRSFRDLDEFLRELNEVIGAKGPRGRKQAAQKSKRSAAAAKKAPAK